MDVRRRINHDGVASTYEVSDDLKIWTHTVLSENITALDADFERVEVSLPISETSLFLRIRLAEE